MKESLLLKLESLSERKTELEGMLSAPEIINDQPKFRELSREYAEVEPISACYHRFNENQKAITSAKEMMKDSDPDMREMAVEEMKEAEANIEALEEELQILLLPKDPSDNSNIFLEIRAGTGGDEAALFVGDLLRMYSRYSDTQKWKMETISQNVSEAGGYKEVIVRIIGQGAYSRMKFESGVHRVQRVPETESQGRVHTSACTIAVLPEVDEIEEIDINPADLRIDTFRASGAGGQHVNKTDSAIRITHVPTGVVVECQEDRSQHKNKARALTLLKSRLLSAEREKQESEQAENRRSLVGTGDRSERIRTYNFPQGRITDHRINLTLYKLDSFLEGDVDQIIEPLIQEHQADLFASMADS